MRAKSLKYHDIANRTVSVYLAVRTGDGANTEVGSWNWEVGMRPSTSSGETKGETIEGGKLGKTGKAQRAWRIAERTEA